LLRLRIVSGNVAGHATADVRALEDRFRTVLEQICRQLTPDEYSTAALAIFGFIASVRGESMTERRRYAAEQMPRYRNRNQGEAFKKRYEPRILDDVATRLHLLEISAPLLQAPVPPAALSPGGAASSHTVGRGGTEEHGEGREKAIVYRGYAWIGSELSYRVSSEDLRQHICTTIREVEILHPDPQPFQDRYQWSGHGREDVPRVLSQGHRLLGEPFQVGSYKVYYVHFDTEFHVGDRTRIHIEQEFEDTDLEFHPFFGAPAHQGQEWLILRVILPVRLAPSTISLNVYASTDPADANLLRSDPGQFKLMPQEAEGERSGTIEWTIDDLVEGHYYAIKWGGDRTHEGPNEFYPPDF